MDNTASDKGSASDKRNENVVYAMGDATSEHEITGAALNA